MNELSILTGLAAGYLNKLDLKKHLCASVGLHFKAHHIFKKAHIFEQLLLGHKSFTLSHNIRT
jgi:VanZ family protein